MKTQRSETKNAPPERGFSHSISCVSRHEVQVLRTKKSKEAVQTTTQHHTGHAKLAWQGSSLCYGVRLQHNIHKLGSYIAQGKSQSDNGAEMILPHLKNTSTNHYNDAAQNKDHDLSILP